MPAGSPSRLRRALVRLAVLAASGVLTFGALEVTLRALDVLPVHRRPLRGLHVHHPSLGWAGVPNHRGRLRTAEFDVEVALGADGFRAPARAFDGPADAPMIAVLGDSFAWGWGVASGETVTDRMQAALGARARVVNFALPGFGTTQQRLELEEVVLPRGPRTVMLFFFANDPNDSIRDQGGTRPWCELVEGRPVMRNHPVRKSVTGWLEALERRSVALSVLDYAADRIAGGAAGNAEAQDGAALRDPAPVPGPLPPWHVSAALLEEMARLCREAQPACELRVVYVPHAVDTIGTEHNDSLRAFLASTCARAGATWLDLTPAFRAAWSSAPDREPNGWPFYFRVDSHWTARGHELAAASL